MARYQQLGIIGDFSITAKKIDFSGKEKVKKTAPAKEKITVLRNENKADITPEVIPAEIKEREQKIRSINQFYSAQSVTLDGKTLNTDVRQIFNSDWNKGGRLYGSKNSYQAVKAADRGRIKINGSMTSELDYSSIHINLLYAYACKQAPEDCYGFFPLRKLAKKALLIALNAKSIDSAAKVLSNEWTTKNPDRPLTIEQAKEVIEDAIDAHAPIKQYICSGVGTGLQRIDSELAIEVVEQCKQQGIVALPIHDSFIVADVNKRKLQKIMTAVYAKYTGGFSCPVAEKAS